MLLGGWRGARGSRVRTAGILLAPGPMECALPQPSSPCASGKTTSIIQTGNELVAFPVSADEALNAWFSQADALPPVLTLLVANSILNFGLAPMGVFPALPGWKSDFGSSRSRSRNGVEGEEKTPHPTRARW